MRPCQRLFIGLVLFASSAAPAWAQSLGERPESLSDRFPWLGEFVTTILGVALLCVLIYLFRPSAIADADFTIHVDGPEVTFKGRFPPELESLVEDFLLNDCQIPDAYHIVGRWNENRLAISVQGASVKPLEQRIRNFLKLNVTRPS